MLDDAIEKAVQAWLNDPAIAAPDKDEIRELQRCGDEKELTDRFYRDLEFGTGGLRGTIGAGINRMNVYTVSAAAQGLANYIARQGEAAKKAGMAIAYDCRCKSDLFAERVATVMAANGIKAYLFERLRPTPELSFAIRHLGCTAGVIVTASHNPPEYNGFKAYWNDGGQVVPPHDKAIIDEVRKVGAFSNIRTMELSAAKTLGLVQMIGHEVDEAFLAQVQATCLAPDLCRKHGATLKIVYSPLHGTGGTLIPEALRRRGFQHVHEVPEQSKPDGEFSTIKSPNPEEAAALNMSIELARRENADLVIATDPDADRVGIAVRRRDGQFELVTGNRIGAMLVYYICEQLKHTGKFPKNGVVLSTVVSSDLMKEIARSYGAEVVETLTGFKWIGAKIREYETASANNQSRDRQGAGSSPNTSNVAPTKTFLFGAEESYGYMPAAFVRDKDAVTSTAFIAEMAAFAAERGQGLCDLLDDIFKRFGYYEEGAKSFTLRGSEGGRQIAALMQSLRTDPPKTIGGIDVRAVADFMTGVDKESGTGKTLRQYDLPKSDVVQFTLSDGTKVIARPSGTEPKIKFYILTKEPSNDLAKARTTASAKIKAIEADLVTRVKKITG